MRLNLSLRRGRRRGARAAGAEADGEVAYGKGLVARGAAAEGERYLRELLERRSAAGVVDGELRVRLALTSAQFAVNRPEQAVAEARALLAASERVRKGGLPLLLTMRILVATALTVAGRHEEAEAEIRAVERQCGASAFAEEKLTVHLARARTLRSAVLASAGRLEEAMAADDVLLPELAATFGAEHDRVAVCRADRAHRRAVAGEVGEGEAECRAVLRTAGGALRLEALLGLTYCLVETGRAAEAEPLVRAALARTERRQGPGDVKAVSLRDALSRSLLGQGRYAEALAVADGSAAGDAWVCSAPGRRPLLRAEALHGLGRTEEAAAAAAGALAEAELRLAPGHPAVLAARTRLALIRGSKQELSAAADAWAAHFGSDHPRAVAAREAAG